MTAYYNEFKPEAAHMLRQLIRDGIIAPGDVDERSIVDVNPDDLRGYTQCHFFAGIGGWSVALRLAGWGDDRSVWTGSCPCQPFSSAGKQEGQEDERHLWPDWFRLIRESKPDTILGEQVARAIAFGWLDEVFNDLETEDYACASAVLPACSVGRPHKRDRLWFVADSNKRRFNTRPLSGQYSEKYNIESRSVMANTSGQGFSKQGQGAVRESGSEQKSQRYGLMGNTEHDGCNAPENRRGNAEDVSRSKRGTQRTEQPEGTGDSGILSGAMADSQSRETQSPATERLHTEPSSESNGGTSSTLGNSIGHGWNTRRDYHGEYDRSVAGSTEYVGISISEGLERHTRDVESSGEGQSEDGSASTSDTATECGWIRCPDGKSRPVEPGIRLLTNGVQHRTPILHAFGNAIVPQVAAEFIKAYRECVE